ncbi:HAD family hydrolase [Nocardioides sp. LHG3406-4]|uniref:HAD family hydrolase n=1 Tax=Nocardioides sp. LHG3406-4 TaxID=2804575 RepID=UPI003CEC09FE
MVPHVLLDADGVMQRVPGGWRETLARVLGDHAEDLQHVLSEIETPTLTGTGDFTAALTAELSVRGIDTPVEELYARLWLAIEVVPDSVALVRSLRAAGHGVHLATNQHARRASYMKTELGYDDLFDSCFYSCDLGLAKPDVAFFAGVAESLGVPTGDVVFVDDSRTNVAAAREAGMHAEVWTVADGPAAIRSLLAACGVTLG